MRIELIPVIVGVIVAIFGVAILYDAIADDRLVLEGEDRRRRARAERSRLGEGLVGMGTLAMAAALVGRDVWKWGTVTVLAGTALLLVGAVLNWRYLRESLLNRGASRRAAAGETIPESPEKPAERLRVR